MRRKGTIMKVLKRQPALVLAFVNALLGWLVTQQWSTLDAAESAAISGLILAASGFAVGALSKDAWIGRLTGLVQAAIFVSIAFGHDVGQDDQQALLGLVAAAGAVFIWDRNFPKERPETVSP